MIDVEELLRSNTETEVLEFKEAKFNYDTNKLGKYFSALGNEANLAGKDRAYLLFGVKNDKTVVGTQLSDAEINNFKHEIANHTSPTMSFIDVGRFSIGGKDVLCCVIPAAPQGMPIAWKDHFYGREGESLGGLHIGEIERIRNQTVFRDWSVKVVDGASIDDLSKKAIDVARKQYAEKNRRLKKEILGWSDKVFLNRARLTINDRITNAAILLLGKPEAEHFISPAQAKITWILKDRDGVEKDYEHFSCPIILSAQHVFKKIRNITYRYMQEGSLFPEEVLQYDPYLIREALNNCIAHQDYALGGKIIVVENEDGCLTFKNSGDFIPGSVENVIESDAPESVYRNPFLVSAMVNLNMIDSVGSGIKRLFDIQRKKFFPLPDFVFSGHTVKLTLYGKILDMKYARALANNENLSIKEVMRLDVAQKKNFAERKNASVESVANSMNVAKTSTFAQTFAQTFTQKNRSRFKQESSFKKACDGCFRLMEFVNQNSNVSSGELAELLNLSRRTVATYLKYLVEAEFLKRVGPDNGGYWVVLGDGK